MKKIILAIFLLNQVQAKAIDSFWGISAGVSFSFGTHVNRIGLNAAGYYNYAFAQANLGIRGYYNFQSMALKEKGFELQIASGFQLGFGRKDSARSPFIGPSENNLLQDYSVGYDYLIYLDKQKTSQTGGLLSVTVLDFKFVTENDLFGFGQGWRDRFRTGGFQLEYRYENFKFALNSTMWTDDYTTCRKILDSDYPARFGYKNDDKTRYCGLCLSTFSARVNYLVPPNYVPLNQNVQFDIGFDAERVRNLFQNKMVHDHRMIPAKWITRNPCHIPMQAEGGGQYLFQEGQEIEHAKFYFNLGLNQGLFY